MGLLAHVTHVHERTYETVLGIPDAFVDWLPRGGKLTIGEIVGHIAASRHMTTRALAGGPWRYEGHELPPRAGANFIRRLAEHSSSTSLARLANVDLAVLVKTSRGEHVPGWQLVVSGLIEHEVHHRSQLCGYLGANGIAPPALSGRHNEDLPG